jgi:hypothetical protein
MRINCDCRLTVKIKINECIDKCNGVKPIIFNHYTDKRGTFVTQQSFNYFYLVVIEWIAFTFKMITVTEWSMVLYISAFPHVSQVRISIDALMFPLCQVM